MKLVKIKIFLFLLLSSASFAQTVSEKLKIEQEKLEKKLSDTKSLLAKSQVQTESSLNELRVIEKQIIYREQLVRNFDNQVRSAELKITEKETQIVQLKSRIAILKSQYKKLVIYAYKHRNKYGDMMYIFSAKSFFEALKRKKYLEKVAKLQKKQFYIIKQNQDLIKSEIAEITKEKSYKKSLLGEKQQEKATIVKDKEKQQAIYENYKTKEGEILSSLKETEKQKEALKRKINDAIKKEIAQAEAKRKKVEAEAEKKRLAAIKNNTSNTETKVNVTETKKETVVFAETKENVSLSKNFEGNRGKLPWPVEKGTITESYGRNAHPTLNNVYTNNDGVDIGAPKNTQIRAVFEGEVTSILNIPGAGKVVIIKHGNYRTVYGNLQDTYVTIGQKITTKQVIGSLLSPSSGNVSTAHFEIHLVTGSMVQSLNPALWISN